MDLLNNNQHVEDRDDVMNPTTRDVEILNKSDLTKLEQYENAGTQVPVEIFALVSL
jgi:hypothetical protein